MSLTKQIQAEYPFRIEAHAHTSPVSRCGKLPPDEVIRQCAERGFNAVCITNHFNLDVAPQGLSREEYVDYYLKDFHEAQRAGERYGVGVILGCEIRFTENENDYLLYGIDREALLAAYDYLDRGFEAFSAFFRSPETVLLQAHPFRKNMVLVNPALLDGIEVFNLHPHHNSRVGLAARYAAEQDFIELAGSDFHDSDWGAIIGLRTKTLPTSSAELAALLRRRDYLFDASGNIIIPHHFGRPAQGAVGRAVSARDIRDYLEANVGNKLTLEDVSAHFFIGKTQIFRLFRDAYGMPPMQYMLRAKVEKAKTYLLQAPPLRVSEIADALGFTDARHFSKTFRRLTGMLPRDYRKQSEES